MIWLEFSALTACYDLNESSAIEHYLCLYLTW